LKEYDLLRGGELYKERWATAKRMNLEIRFIQRDVFPRFYDWITSSETVNYVASKLHIRLSIQKL